MQKLFRVNPSGVSYTLTEVFSPIPQTTIRTGDKFIVVNVFIHDVIYGWHLWTEGRQLAQNAFPFLSNAEREFLITGLTEDEWNELIVEEEEMD